MNFGLLLWIISNMVKAFLTTHEYLYTMRVSIFITVFHWIWQTSKSQSLYNEQ